MRKKLFDIEFDPSQAPGYRSRVRTLDNIVGERIKSGDDDQGTDIFGGENLREKFKSQQIDKLNPGVILRRKGVRV